MSTEVALSKSGTHFQLRCSHCDHLREELVNPALNENPFSYNPNCSGCDGRLDPDMEFIAAVQTSLTRALLFQAKKTAQSGEAMGGASGGNKMTGSPEYSATTKATPADVEFMLPPHEDAQANRRVDADINRSATDLGLPGNQSLLLQPTRNQDLLAG